MDAPPASAPKPCCVCGYKGGQHCTKCKSRHYCGKACQLVDWRERGHKAQCKRLAAEYQDRLLDSLMPEKLAIKEDVAPAAGSKAEPRLSAVQKGNNVDAKAGAVNGGAPSWRGKCAICLDLLPVELRRHVYACCCETVCADCHKKCREYDERCPICRSAPSTSEAERLRWLQKNVDKGNAEAQHSLGGLYQDGVWFKQSLKQALKFYNLAAAQGHPGAQYRLGCYHYSGEHDAEVDCETAALWFRRAAEQGHPQSQLSLGAMFCEGEGVAQSHEEAAKWVGLAAAQGIADALYDLGAFHANGCGVPQDLREALRCFKRAKAQGHTDTAAAIDQIAALLAAPA